MPISRVAEYRDDRERTIKVLQPLAGKDVEPALMRPTTFLACVILTAQGRGPQGQVMQAQQPVEIQIPASDIEVAFAAFDQAVNDFIERKKAEQRRILVPKNRINGA